MFNINNQYTEQLSAMKELQTMDAHSSTAIGYFKEYAQNAYNAFWYGSTSPSLKAELLGTGALEVFTKSAQAQAFIKSVIPDHVELGIPPEYTVAWNQDGSCVITSNQES